MTMDIPTDLTFSKIPTGDTKIPDPIIIPTIIQTAWNKFICFFSRTVVTIRSLFSSVGINLSEGSVFESFIVAPLENPFEIPLETGLPLAVGDLFDVVILLMIFFATKCRLVSTHGFLHLQLN